MFTQNKISSFLVAASCLSFSLSALSGQGLSPDIALAKSGAKIPYSEMKLQDFGLKRFTVDDTGIRRMSALPAPGIHPRMFHSPEDRAPMQRIYQETEHGQLVWRMLLGWTDKLKGKLVNRHDFPKHPNGQYLGPYNRGGWTQVAEQYSRIQNGDLEGYKAEQNDQILGGMAMEAYRCWIEEDAAAGRELCRTLEIIVDHLHTIVKPGDRTNSIGAYHMGFCYDYGYNFMTRGQRDKVRSLIAKVSLNKSHYGAFLEPDGTTSNWCTLDSFMPMTLLAIEGEEGFNEDYWNGFLRAYRNFITYGWYASGTPYEGLGKNYQFNTTMMLVMRRGLNLAAHSHVRAYGTQFLPAISLPNQNGFLATDDWGGTGGDSVNGNYRFNSNDIIGLKWLYPQDPAIDYCWQLYAGQNYERMTNLRPTGYYSDALMAVMFPSAPNTPTAEYANTGADNTYFCPERGYMIARSDDSTDSLFLSLHCRQDKGGHSSADRNTFVFGGLGRLWGYQMNIAGGSKFGKVNETRFFSSILIDDVGQCGMASGCFPVPGKVVDFQDSDLLTYATGDAKYAYDWEWSWESGDPNVDSPKLAHGWEKVLETPNDFQFERVNLAYMDKPFYMQHHWLAPGKVQHYVKKPWNPVQRAFRTAAMVRGENPYVLIVDDIQKDDEQHQYKWMMQAAQDLEIIKFDFSKDSDIADIYLSSNTVPRNAQGILSPAQGDACLLVRVLQCENDMSERRYTPVGRLEQYMSNIRWPKAAGKRLIIPSYSIAPDYKIMLFPYRHGDEIPQTVWNANKTELDVRWNDQVDRIQFEKDASGRTQIALERVSP